MVIVYFNRFKYGAIRYYRTNSTENHYQIHCVRVCHEINLVSEGCQLQRLSITSFSQTVGTFRFFDYKKKIWSNFVKNCYFKKKDLSRSKNLS